MRKVQGVTPSARQGEDLGREPAPAGVLPYLVHLPEEYGADPDREWPLVLFLHGAGERGSDLAQLTAHGLPKLAEAGREFPFVLVSPQCPWFSQWVNETTVLAGLLDEIAAAYRIDASRVYLTGLSMGGFGAWSLAVRHPERFAALAPICGGQWDQGYARVRDLPTWIFHGDDDQVVPFALTERIVTELTALGADLRFTRYPGVGHDSWTRTYENPKFYDWLLGHRRKG